MTVNKATASKQVPCLIVCALACEAKPIIDFYQLKKSPQKQAFNVYKSGSITVLISGIGSLNMAAAVNWYFGLNALTAPTFLLNLGVAGHSKAEIGTLYCAVKIQHNSHSNSYYPPQWLKHKIARSTIITVDTPEQHYNDNCLYDMEAYAFYQASVRYVPQEMIQSLKIVSDNPQQQLNKDKAAVAALIAKHITTIDTYIQQYLDALTPLVTPTELDRLYTQLSQQHHFTVSQSHQLKALLQSALSHDVAIDVFERSNAKAVINTLKQQILNSAVNV